MNKAFEHLPQADDLIHWNGRTWQVIGVIGSDDKREGAIEVIPLDRLPPSGAGMRNIKTMIVPTDLLPPGSVFRPVRVDLRGLEFSESGRRR